MSILQKLTEGVQSRDMQAEGAALLNKWEATGLLEGLGEGQAKQGMAVLLENQAKELLREASSMAAGDVEGFAAVAFPIVRRVFGGLIANDLVSVQPMSLPSGLIFFLDFTHSESNGGAVGGKSVYGGDEVGKQIAEGVTLGSEARGFYNLGNAFSAPHETESGLATVDAALLDDTVSNILADEAKKKLIRYDADLLALDSSTRIKVIEATVDQSTDAAPGLKTVMDAGLVAGITATLTAAGGTALSGNEEVVRRLTKVTADGNNLKVQLTIIKGNAHHANHTVAITYPIVDRFAQGGATGAVLAGDVWGLEEPAGAGASQTQGNVGSNVGKNEMQEIDIKVDSIAVTAQTKKLKAKWSPELGQDLNAYHNLDAEVELTGILSEQIALEIDRELLGELVDGATAGTRYWSRAPGLFVDSSGAEIGHASAAPDFTGTVSEWYETLIETINDVSAQIHRKTLRGGANFVVCSPEVANILEFTSGFRASVTADQDRGTIGAVRAGSLSKKFDVYVDPYFLRNVILVGRKGSSFLESGFVYAPYVPLQVTPTIFGTEDFVPRKGVMTRYAKKMVRPDMYGLVVVRGLLGEAGK